MTFYQGQRMTLNFDTHSTSLTHLAVSFKQLGDLWLQKFPKNKYFSLFPIQKAYVTKFDIGVKWVKVNPG